MRMFVKESSRLWRRVWVWSAVWSDLHDSPSSDCTRWVLTQRWVSQGGGCLSEGQRRYCDVDSNVGLIKLLRFLNETSESLQKWVAALIDYIWRSKSIIKTWCKRALRVVRNVRSKFITLRNSSCGKVIFSQACVKNSVYRGRYTPLGRPPRHPLDSNFGLVLIVDRMEFDETKWSYLLE